MGHGNFPNSFNMFGEDQSQNYSHQPGLAYPPFGGPPLATENNSFVMPSNNMFTDRVHCDPYWNLRGRENNQYASSSHNREIHYFPPAPQLQSYCPFPYPENAGNLSMHPSSDASHMHSSYYNRQIIERGMADPIIGNEVGSLKRKGTAGPTFAGNFEIGSSSSSTRRSNEAGSSYSPYHILVQNPVVDQQSQSLGPILIPEHRGDGLPIGHEASLRNVRRRSALPVEHNPMRTHFSCHPPQVYNSTTFLPNPSVQVKSNDLSVQWNNQPFSAAALGRPIAAPAISVSSHGNQFTVGGSAVNAAIGNPHTVSNRYPVSSSHISGGTSTQAARESHSAHFGRATAVTSESLRSHRPSSNSRYSRPFFTRGWQNSCRNGRSRTAIPRFRPTSGVVEARTRMGSQLSNHASFDSGPRSTFDRYRDMRLDIDNMSYEELLALGETIGNVNIGLSDDVVSECVTEKFYCSGDQSHDGHCTICLEEYEKDVDTIGMLKSCGHDYHADCIKKWLGLKKFCPICKVAA